MAGQRGTAPRVHWLALSLLVGASPATPSTGAQVSEEGYGVGLRLPAPGSASQADPSAMPRPVLQRGFRDEFSHFAGLAAGIGAVGDDPGLHKRGKTEVRVYRSASPSVVLVVTRNGLGSGSLVRDGTIITNWHVVAGDRNVGVVFKPKPEGREATPADLHRASVVLVDELTDLALLKLQDPQADVAPLPLGSMNSISVGSDAHAIGHPTGQTWTYTRGIISQIRRGFKWTDESQVPHEADVIQTQTPINPGNSGGPLLNDLGEMIGVNTFKGEGEGLGFSVAVDEVRVFLERKESRRTRVREQLQERPCEPNILQTTRWTEPQGQGLFIDLDCDEEADVVAVTPDDADQPVRWLMDMNSDGTTDVVLLDLDRDGKIDQSFIDSDYDGKADLKGYHDDGGPIPSRLERLAQE